MNLTKVLLVIVVIGIFAIIGMTVYEAYRSVQANAGEAENQGASEGAGFEASTAETSDF